MSPNFIDAQYLRDWIGRNSNPSGVMDTEYLHSCYRVFEKDKTGKRRYWSHERIDTTLDGLISDGVVIHHDECPRRIRLASMVGTA